MNKAVDPVAKLSGEIVPPPDKSISHRSAMFAALSSENSIIQNHSSAADPQSTLECLKQLGVEIHQEGSTVKISGVGRDGFQYPEKPLDCGNSGTTMRLLSGIVAGAGVECTMIGDESLSARTMKRIIDPLRKMGCKIDGKEGIYAPLEIHSHDGVKGMRYPLPIASAQLKSCVLLAGLFGDEPTEVVEDVLSRDHTERLLQLETEPYGSGKIIQSSRDHIIPPQNYRVPGDFSAAAFWLVAGSIHENAEIHLSGTGVNPSRDAVYHILEEMGASFKKTNNRLAGKEPVSDLFVESSDLKPIHLDPALIPNCIDELPILMVAMCFADGKSVITGAEELRHKETDRLSAMAEILNLAGTEVELQQDGIIIQGRRDFKPSAATFPTYHDHRMAMAAAVLATKGTDTSAITHADCTAISYPKFWTDLQTLSDSAA
ncbi:MAG: 3-phosphoshikimate 1-carboxyvinyltransferase [Balneolaceae bacterium]|nr:3-phosphoshikimate 1-carboxyvinyltransferase [Balneolaceae bacterium]MDR9408974.1 3-phosphoshikimate 1-carboxyvinyltransferase [Balneolaceae bacterium]